MVMTVMMEGCAVVTVVSVGYGGGGWLFIGVSE